MTDQNYSSTGTPNANDPVTNHGLESEDNNNLNRSNSPNNSPFISIPVMPQDRSQSRNSALVDELIDFDQYEKSVSASVSAKKKQKRTGESTSPRKRKDEDKQITTVVNTGDISTPQTSSNIPIQNIHSGIRSNSLFDNYSAHSQPNQHQRIPPSTSSVETSQQQQQQFDCPIKITGTYALSTPTVVTSSQLPPASNIANHIIGKLRQIESRQRNKQSRQTNKLRLIAPARPVVINTSTALNMTTTSSRKTSISMPPPPLIVPDVSLLPLVTVSSILPPQVTTTITTMANSSTVNTPKRPAKTLPSGVSITPVTMSLPPSMGLKVYTSASQTEKNNIRPVTVTPALTPSALPNNISALPLSPVIPEVSPPPSSKESSLPESYPVAIMEVSVPVANKSVPLPSGTSEAATFPLPTNQTPLCPFVVPPPPTEPLLPEPFTAETATGQSLPKPLNAHLYQSISNHDTKKIHTTSSATQSEDQQPSSSVSKASQTVPVKVIENSTVNNTENRINSRQFPLNPQKVSHREVAMKVIEKDEVIHQAVNNIFNFDDENGWPDLETPQQILRNEELEVDNAEITECDWDGKSFQERYKILWSSEKYAKYLDFKFEVGSGIEKTVISAHRLILTVTCQNFLNVLENTITPGNCTTPSLIKLPDMSPEAIHIMLKYIYTDELQFTNSVTAFAVLKAASKFGCSDLITECISFLQSIIYDDNAIEIWDRAVSIGAENLKAAAMQYIYRNTLGVLYSEGFLKIDEGCLCRFLECDDWYLNELDVFGAAKRWASEKLPFTNAGNTKDRGMEIRKKLGRAIFEIRFLSFDSNTFINNIEKVNLGLFTDSEALSIIRYLSCKPSGVGTNDSDLPPPPSGYNRRPRIQQEPPSSSTDFVVSENNNNMDPSTTTENNWEINSNPSIDALSEYHNEAIIIDGQLMKPVPITFDSMSTSNQIKPTNSAFGNEENSNRGESHYQPPPKKRKYKRNSSCVEAPSNSVLDPVPPAIVSPAPIPNTYATSPDSVQEMEVDLTPTPKLKSYSDFVTALKQEPNLQLRTSIIALTKLKNVPSVRLDLPNLKTVDLDFELTSQTNIKNAFKTKFASLSDILFFFNKKGCSSENPIQGRLEKLVSRRINISIKCNKIWILDIDHGRKTLLMHFLKDAKKILDGCKNFKIEEIAISDCELSSLEPLQKGYLKRIIIRRVKGLKNHAEFLSQCRNLQEVSWNELSSEQINLTSDILDKNKPLIKLGLVKCKLTTTGISAGFKSDLQELYLDNCDLKPVLVPLLPTLFPHLKRVQIYGKNCDATLLHHILKIQSIEYIFAWEFVYQYRKEKSLIKGKRKMKDVLTEESLQIKNLLGGIFKEKFAERKNMTFILQKKMKALMPGALEECFGSGEQSQSENTAIDPFHHLYWTGVELNKQDRFLVVSKHDFTNYSYSEFFPDYNTYRLFEATEKDLNKRKSIAKGNTTNPVASTATGALGDLSHQNPGSGEVNES